MASGFTGLGGLVKQKLLNWLIGGIVKDVRDGKKGLRTRLFIYFLNKEVNKMDLSKMSWQPKALAIVGIVSLIINAVKALLDSDPNTNVDMGAIMTQLPGLIALFTVRQNNKSSEQVSAGVIPPK